MEITAKVVLATATMLTADTSTLNNSVYGDPCFVCIAVTFQTFLFPLPLLLLSLSLLLLLRFIVYTVLHTQSQSITLLLN